MSLSMKLAATAASVSAFLLTAAPPAWSFVPQDEEEQKDEEEEEKAEEEEEDEYLAIVGGDVYIGTGGILRGATILSKNGKIDEIGYNVHVPIEAEKLDATGYRVYPGLVAIEASSRLSSGSFAFDPPFDEGGEVDGDGHDHGDPSTDPHFGLDDMHPAELADRVARGEGHLDGGEDFAAEDSVTKNDFEDGFDPFSSYMVMALSAGVTTAAQGDTAAKLKRGEIEGVSMNEKHMNNFSWSSSGRTKLREDFARAAEYLREYRAWEEVKKKDKEAKEPSSKGVNSGALAVLKGEQLASFRVDGREDILGVARLAQQFGFRPVIRGCREGWTIADELGRAGAYAIVTPRERRDKDERLIRPGGSSIENAAKLHAAGVQVAIIPANTSIDLGGITGRDLLHFPVEAGFAVRGGMSNDAALAGITIVPARLLGVDHRVGTLEVGKDCDAIITDGDVLHYQTFVQWTVVEGKVVYDKQEELLFHHIRPRPEPPAEVVEEIEEEPAEVDVEEDDEGEAEEGEEEGGEEGEGEGGEEGGGR